MLKVRRLLETEIEMGCLGFLFSFYSLGACLCGFRGLIVERGGVGEQKFPDSLVAVFSLFLLSISGGSFSCIFLSCANLFYLFSYDFPSWTLVRLILYPAEQFLP
ncbi:hypothetical protein DFP73DRAFT_284307 [Morchella snyderi]|nr:hypothetical protein DFP73DRAFT_284307 [Morchella snyderi]